MQQPPSSAHVVDLPMVQGGAPVSRLPPEDDSMMAKVFRSTTMEEFDSLIGDNDDLLFDLVGLLPPEVRGGCE